MLDKIVKSKMINKILDPIFNNKVKNIETIKNALKHMISESDMDMILFMVCEPDYKMIQQGDIVKWKTEKWEIKDKVELDRMKDCGLMNKSNFIYGRVIDDTSYKDDFNPFHYEMKVEAFLLNMKENDEFDGIKPYEMNIKTLRLNKSKVPEEWLKRIKNLE